MSRRDPVLSLEDMRDAIVTIEEYVEGLTFDQYITEKKTKDAVIRNFELPGEAATHVPEVVRTEAPEIPWNRIIGLRNTVIHHYFGIDHTIIWFIIREQLPGLEKQIDVLLLKLSRKSSRSGEYD